MRKIIEIKYGSHLYGTDTPNSDLDIKGIYLPTAEEIVLGRYPKTIQTKRPKAHGERNTKDDVDVEYLSLDRFLQLLAEGQTMALDMLFAPSYNMTHLNQRLEWIWFCIVVNRHRILHKNVNAFVGYARQQAAKYGIKGSRMDALKRTVEMLKCLDPHSRLNDHTFALDGLLMETAELVSLEKSPLIQYTMCKGPKGEPQQHLEVCNRKVPLTGTVKHALQIYEKVLAEYGARSTQAHLDGGKDWKALSHAVRVASEATELLRTGHITMPRPDADLIKRIKTGQVPYEEVSVMIEQGLVELMDAQKASTLRDAPDQQWIDDFVAAIYTRIVKGEL